MKNSAWSPSKRLVGSQEKENRRKAAARGSKYLKKSSLWLSPPGSPPGVSEEWGGGLLGPWGYLEGIWSAVLKRTPTCLASPRVSLASGSAGAWRSSTGLSVLSRTWKAAGALGPGRALVCSRLHWSLWAQAHHTPCIWAQSVREKCSSLVACTKSHFQEYLWNSPFIWDEISRNQI